LGQEAAQVGSGRALRPQDMAFPTYREHGVLYCRGIDPIMPFGLFRGVDQGGWDPNEFKFNTYTIVIGSQTLHATGYAMGITMDGKTGTPDGEAVIAYFGDGATSQGEVNEAFVWSGVFHAPIVFFCQNNQYAISEPLERQTRIPLYRRSAGFGFPGVRIDGNDVLASYAVTRSALDSARNGQGPTLIEAYTYRMGAHTSSDDPTRYRIASEVESWKAKDPISRMRAFLTKQQIAGDDFFSEVDETAGKLALDLRERVLALPDPQPVSMFDNVYPGGSPEVDAQRAWFERYEASFDGSVH
jgi:pyruvate dehydrogenase E1 component alpha subunit